MKKMHCGILRIHKSRIVFLDKKPAENIDREAFLKLLSGFVLELWDVIP